LLSRRLYNFIIMSKAKPAFVFVPGAWHTPEGYRKVRAILEGKGYTTFAVSLPSVGGNPVVPNSSQDIAAVKTVLADLIEKQGKEVVVVAHSYGGVPGSEAVQGLGRPERAAANADGGVIRIVYIASGIPQAGQSLADYFRVAATRFPDERGPDHRASTYEYREVCTLSDYSLLSTCIC
jgi:pimeloyl-ACP methyl ester carboxylesterase